MSPREQRILQNEELFRDVNAHIAKLEDRIGSEDEPLPLICECANSDCTTPITVDHGTFEAVRARPLRFLVAAGHEKVDESVIDSGPGFLIVEKTAPR